MKRVCRASVRFVAVALAGLFLQITGLHAQEGQIGYLGKGKDQYSVFVFGDALAGGLWAGSARVAAGHSRLKLNGRYREGSGLAKPQIYDWAERLPATLENRQIDIAIVMIGINDAQDIRKEGEPLAFNSPPWRTIYIASVAKMMGHFTANKTAVYWLEVPPVKRPGLDQRLKVIAAIHKDQAVKAGIRFVEIRKNFTTANDEFSMTGVGIDGNILRLRSRNGIRFIRNGNNKMASIVLKQIERDIAIADGDTPVANFPVPDSANIASVTSGPYAGPVFGSAASDETALIIQPTNIPVAGSDRSNNVLVSIPTFGAENQSSANSTALTGRQIVENLKSDVSPGSAAYTLFSEGLWPETPSGRLDDFRQSTN